MRKKPTVLQSTFSAKSQGFSFRGAFTDKHLHKNSEKQWNVYIQFKDMFTPYYALLSMIFSFSLHFCFLEVSLYYHLCLIYFMTSSGTFSHLFCGFSPSSVLMHYLVQTSRWYLAWLPDSYWSSTCAFTIGDLQIFLRLVGLKLFE